MSAARIACRTPTPGRKPTRIDPWKFVRIRNVILAILAECPNGVPFKELPDRVRQHLGEEEAAQTGSINWFTTTIKLELEVRGEVRRLDQLGPQVLAGS